VYKEIFQKLAEEEEDAYAYDRGEDAGDFHPYPSFGDSKIPIDLDDLRGGSPIKNFYTSWINFSTQKSFKWFDKHRLSEVSVAIKVSFQKKEIELDEKYH